MRNSEFLALFGEKIREYGESVLTPERVNAAMSAYTAQFEPLMEDFYKRFGNYKKLWDNYCKWVPEFFEERYEYISRYVVIKEPIS